MKRKTILLGVTADVSLTLMRGFPEHLRDQGWHVHVVSSPGPRLHALSEVEGVTTHALSMAREPSPFHDLRALIAWIRLLRAVRPNVISVGTPKAGLLGGLAGVVTRVPKRVYLLRGLRLETATGPTRRLLALLEMISLRCAGSVVAVSESLRQRVLALKLETAKKLVVLGSGSSNGVDLTAFSDQAVTPEAVDAARRSAGLVDAVPVVGFVGRLTADKGLSTLAAARAELERRGVDHQLLVVGRIDGGDDVAVVEQVVSAGRPAALVGYVDDPTPYFRLMDVHCLPTLREGFPNVVLEASASRVPTVTTDATGAVDSVIDGKTGLVVPKEDSTALADALQTLLEDEKKRTQLGLAALDFVTDHFSRPDVWRATEAFYSELLG